MSPGKKWGGAGGVVVVVGECHHPTSTLWLSLRHRQIYQLPEPGDCQKPARNNGKWVVVPAMRDRRPW